MYEYRYVFVIRRDTNAFFYAYQIFQVKKKNITHFVEYYTKLKNAILGEISQKIGFLGFKLENNGIFVLYTINVHFKQ